MPVSLHVILMQLCIMHCLFFAVFDSSLSSEVPDLEDSPVPMTSCNVTGLLEVESPILNLSSSLTNSNDTFDQLLDDLGEGQCR